MTVREDAGEDSVRRAEWALAVVSFGATIVALLSLGWIGPDIDVWYGAGVVRALGERPLDAALLGHVPKLGHLLLLAPAVLFGATPERWLLVSGVLSLAFLLWSHARWAASSHLPVPLLLLTVALVPLTWRATLDGGSVPWAWSCVLLALASLPDDTRRAAIWLGVGALFRPECVGVGLALALYERVRGARGAWRLALVPVVASALATALVDMLWTGTLGASSSAHLLFESVSLEQVRGRWGFLDTGHPWLHLSAPLLIVTLFAVVAWARDRTTFGGTGTTGTPQLLVAVAGFSLVTVANVALGGTLFVRFLLPLVTLVAVAASQAARLAPPRLRVLLLALVAVAGVPAWGRLAPEFIATYPAAPALLVARRVARATAPELTIAMDAGVRAVVLGSGVRPWKTSPWLLASPTVACASQAVLARAALLDRLDQAQLNRCGPWRDFVVDTAQSAVGLRLLLARRAPR